MHMNYKNVLSEIEFFFNHHEKRNWKPYIEQIKRVISENSKDVEVNIRILYLLHNILCEGNWINNFKDF